MDTLLKLQQTAPFSFLEKIDNARSPLQQTAGGTTRSEYARRFGERNEAVTTDCRALPIYHSALPNGRRAPLLKAMITTTCERGCRYCPFHPSTNIARIQFTPEEMASVFMQLYQSGRVHGLFLSSGLKNGGANSQNAIIETAYILRHRFGFKGYLHLKIMPGAEIGQVHQAMRLADRVSVNLEAPNAQRLKALAPAKRFREELVQPLQWIEQLRAASSPHTSYNNRWPSSSTQFVVGASGESDLEILQTSQFLFTHQKLARVYYMAFTPQPGTPFENLPPERPSREHHLYQASILLKHYQFHYEELPFDENGNLPETTDPKLALAQKTLADNPVEINHASPENLLRIPGIGPTGARSILKARKVRALKDLSQLVKLGILAERAAPFILLDGQRPSYQMQLF